MSFLAPAKSGHFRQDTEARVMSGLTWATCAQLPLYWALAPRRRVLGTTCPVALLTLGSECAGEQHLPISVLSLNGMGTVCKEGPLACPSLPPAGPSPTLLLFLTFQGDTSLPGL